jgi:hypothetical protein
MGNRLRFRPTEATKLICADLFSACYTLDIRYSTMMQNSASLFVAAWNDSTADNDRAVIVMDALSHDSARLTIVHDGAVNTVVYNEPEANSVAYGDIDWREHTSFVHHIGRIALTLFRFTSDTDEPDCDIFETMELAPEGY